MICFFCRGELAYSTTTHVVSLDKCIIIVKNVPCTRCEQCEETFFDDNVARQLEKIVEDVKHSIMSELAIIDYLQAA